jgi:MFS family permease
MHELEAYSHLRHNVRINIVQGIYSVMSNQLITPFLPLFAIKVLDASDTQVAWISSLPALTGILVLLPSAFYIDRLAAKKHFTGLSLYAARFFFLLIALLPFFPLSDYWLAWMLVVLMALMNIPTSLASLSWQSFIGDVIPAAHRANVFGVRNRITQAVGLLTSLICGVLIARNSNSGASVYQLFFFAAFGLGMIEAWYLYKIREPRPLTRTAAKPRLLDSLKAMRTERTFMVFALASSLFHFGWQMAWPLFNIYQASPEYANMSALWISVINVVNTLAGVLTYRWWGKVATRIGHGYTLVIGTAGLATGPLLYSFTMNAWWLVAFNLWMGMFVACTMQTLFNRVLEVSPAENRSFFIAMHSVFIGITAFLAPQFGVWMMGATSIQWAFVISSGLRFLGVFALLLEARWEKRPSRSQT